MLSPIEILIDRATGANQPPKPRVLTAEEKEACAQLGRDVLSDLRHCYPVAAIHLRNTVASKAAMMLRGVLENKSSSDTSEASCL